MRTRQCMVCQAAMRVSHEGLLLGRHRVDYYLCGECDYWCTDEPFWLEEAYSQAISAADTGIVMRNLMVARDLTAILSSLFGSGPFVDWAGGHGMLVRLMRDRGFDFYWADAYAENLLASGFEWRGSSAEAVTAIEVLEHVSDPVAFIDECLAGAGSDTLIFSQQLHQGPDPDWWYLTPATGQHVSFYSARTLAVLGARLGLTLHRSPLLYMLTKREVPTGKFARAVRFSRFLAPVNARRRPSLVEADHQAMLARLAKQGNRDKEPGGDP